RAGGLDEVPDGLDVRPTRVLRESGVVREEDIDRVAGEMPGDLLDAVSEDRELDGVAVDRQPPRGGDEFEGRRGDATVEMLRDDQDSARHRITSARSPFPGGAGRAASPGPRRAP